MTTAYAFAADLVLVAHFAVVLFIVGGLGAILLGNALGWNWVNGRAFRFVHLAAIGIVVALSWLGELCPLTTLESWLRVQSGALPYQKSFIADWVQRLLYFDAPWWVFTAAYTAFGLGVLWVFFRFPVVPRRERFR